jgi:hypothetical protein
VAILARPLKDRQSLTIDLRPLKQWILRLYLPHAGRLQNQSAYPDRG